MADTIRAGEKREKWGYSASRKLAFRRDTYGSKYTSDGLHGRPDWDPDKVPWSCSVRWIIERWAGSRKIVDIKRLTRNVFWVNFCVGDDSNNTDDADTVVLMSARSDGGRDVGVQTYNPAVRKIPVKMVFCRVEVRRRHSRGTGWMRC